MLEVNRRSFLAGLASVVPAAHAGPLGKLPSVTGFALDGIGALLSADGTTLLGYVSAPSMSGTVKVPNQDVLLRASLGSGTGFEALGIVPGAVERLGVDGVLRAAEGGVDGLTCELAWTTRDPWLAFTDEVGKASPEMREALLASLKPGMRGFVDDARGTDWRDLDLMSRDGATYDAARTLMTEFPCLAPLVHVELLRRLQVPLRRPVRIEAGNGVLLDQCEVISGADGAVSFVDFLDGAVHRIPEVLRGVSWTGASRSAWGMLPRALATVDPGHLPTDADAWSALMTCVETIARSGLETDAGDVASRVTHLLLRAEGRWADQVEAMRGACGFGAHPEWMTCVGRGIDEVTAMFDAEVLRPLLHEVDPLVAKVVDRLPHYFRPLRCHANLHAMEAARAVLWEGRGLPELTALMRGREPWGDERLRTAERAHGPVARDALSRTVATWADVLPDGARDVDGLLAHPALARYVADVRLLIDDLVSDPAALAEEVRDVSLGPRATVFRDAILEHIATVRRPTVHLPTSPVSSARLDDTPITIIDEGGTGAPETVRIEGDQAHEADMVDLGLPMPLLLPVPDGLDLVPCGPDLAGRPQDDLSLVPHGTVVA